MDKKLIKITRPAQFEKLIRVMKENPDLARGKGQFGSSKKQQENEWEQISQELNSIGPPMRTTKEWQRVWIHYKANLKRKMANNKKNLTTTGGGPSEHISLNMLEESVVELIELQSSINPTGSPFGFGRPRTSPPPPIESDGNEENMPLGDIDPIPATSSLPFIRSGTPKRKNTAEDVRLSCIQTQTENHTEILKVLNRIEKVIYKSYEISKKQLKLLEKFYELEKKKAMEASELHALNRQLKMRKIELIEMQLNSNSS